MRFLVLDVTGHSTETYDAAKVSTAEAMARFEELTTEGYTAAKLAPDGKHDVIHEFDPTADETLFFPALQGG